MLFSVIVPVYNGERFLRECLGSIKAQTFDDYELVIVDDGSTDESSAIADEYASAHPNTRVLHGPNQGLLLARRRGLRSAQGRYIVFLDSDDALRDDALQILAMAIRDSGVDIVGFSHSREPGYKKPAGVRERLKPMVYKGTDFQRVKEKVCEGRFNSLCGKAIRLDTIDIGVPYDSYKGLMHGEDWFQLMPIIDASKSFQQLDDILYFYRQNDTSSTAGFREKQLDDITIVNKRLAEYAVRWGGDCPAIARVGEALQYTYLLKLSELSQVSDDEKSRNFSVICDVMQRENVFERARRAHLRPDNRLLVRTMEQGNLAAARAIVRIVEAMKR